ncbi:MAG: hypothetical protein KME48_16800 [Candidatus Thiodiazotropha sp. (ex Ctena orbiculata)]|nr:hypothetical protein [Candidatus Thiodiazotropha taylori]
MEVNHNERNSSNILVKIHQAKWFEIVAHPSEARYNLNTCLETASNVKLLANTIHEILEELKEYINIECVQQVPGFELLDDNVVPTIEITSQCVVDKKPDFDVVHDILASFLYQVVDVIHPVNCAHGYKKCSNTNIKEFVDKAAEVFLSKRCNRSLKQSISLLVQNRQFDIGGLWHVPEQVSVRQEEQVLIGRIDQLIRISSKTFTVRDVKGNTTKINYMDDNHFMQLNSIHKQQRLYSFKVLKKIFNVPARVSYGYIAAEPAISLFQLESA